MIRRKLLPLFLFIPFYSNAQFCGCSTIFSGNGNTTGVRQTPLTIGNWTSPVTQGQYNFYTTDIYPSILEIHSTRWVGGLSLTRDDPNGSTSLMSISSAAGSGAVMTIYNASNQVNIQFNSTGDSYFNGGNLAIGTTNAQGYKLAVNGSAIFTKATVKLFSNWPDYVFHKDYHNTPIDSLEQYIKINNRLPEIPSAEEVEKNGVDLGDNQAALLKKIEELTLYIIQQHKELEQLKEQNKKLLEQNNNQESLQQRIDRLEKLVSAR